VSNDASNANGTVKTNTATVTDGVRSDNGTASVTVVEPELVLTKTANDTTPHLGDIIQYTLTVDHSPNSAHTAHDITLNDLLPSSDLSILNITAVGGTNLGGLTVSDFVITGNGSGIALAPGLQGIYDLALADDFNLTYTVQVTNDTADYGASYTNTLNTTWSSLPGTDPEERTGSGGVNDHFGNTTATVTIVGADIQVDKDDGVITVAPGTLNHTYTLNVTNKAGAFADNATNVVVTDAVPFGMTLNQAATSANAYFTNFNSTTGMVTWTIPTMAIGASELLPLVVDVDNPAPAGITNFTNTVNVTQADIDPTPADNSDTDVDALNGAPDLVVTKTLNTGPNHTAGASATYTISVTNAGNQNAKGVTLTDLFPTAGLDFVSVEADVAHTSNTAADGGHVFISNINGTLTWDLGHVIAGETITLNVSATAKNPLPVLVTNFTNTATVNDDGSGNPDPTPGNNVSNATGQLVGAPDLLVTKTDGVDIVLAGQTTTYTLTVQNVGSRNATGVDVVDTLPADLQFVSASAGGVYDGANRTITWDNLEGGVIAGTVRGAGLDTITLTVTALAPSSVTSVTTVVNTVVVTDDGANGADENPLNNNARDEDIIRPPFVFDSIRNQAETDDGGSGFFRRPEDLEFTLPPLPISPLYSGSTEPGTTLHIRLFDAEGREIGTQTVVADVGGNWVAGFPSVILFDQPHAIEMQQVTSTMNESTLSGFNLRTYFSPATHGQLFFSHALSPEMVFGVSPWTVLQSLHEALNNPLALRWDDFYAYEYLAASTTPSQYAR
jgi:uncharacterized repeat protein (TIGR01451 family)